jgi:hypothetical protein
MVYSMNKLKPGFGLWFIGVDVVTTAAWVFHAIKLAEENDSVIDVRRWAKPFEVPNQISAQPDYTKLLVIIDGPSILESFTSPSLPPPHSEAVSPDPSRTRAKGAELELRPKPYLLLSRRLEYFYDCRVDVFAWLPDLNAATQAILLEIGVDVVVWNMADVRRTLSRSLRTGDLFSRST